MSDWKDIVRSVAPILGGAIGGPFGGVATKFLADNLLGESTEGKSQSELEAALEGAMGVNSPETLAKIKQIDADFKVKMRELGITEAKLFFDDVKDARERNVKLSDITPATLAFLVTFGFFGVLAVFMFTDVPKESETVLNIMLGSLGTAWTSIIGFYFGSSRSSEIKNYLLSSKPAEQPTSSVPSSSPAAKK